MSKKECVAMLLAGGEGRRLAPLTSTMAKPAVPFGGQYRIIDFPLSNCVNSKIDTVGVLTQYEANSLHQHIGSGEPWGLHAKPDQGVKLLPSGVEAVTLIRGQQMLSIRTLNLLTAIIRNMC